MPSEPDAEDWYRTLFDASPLPMLVFDSETFRLLGVNEAAVKQYGWPREELLGLTMLELRPPEDIPLFKERLARLTSERTHVGLGRHRRKDGSVFTVDVHTQEIRYGGRRSRLTVAADVTTQLKDSEGRRAAEELLHTIVRSAPVVFFKLDLQARFVLVEGNSSVAHDTPLPELIGRSALEVYGSTLMLREDGVLIAGSEAVRRVLAGETVRGFVQLGERCYDNHMLPIWRDGEVAGVIGISTDVTERCRAEKTMRASEERYRLIVETATEGIWVLDPEFRTLFANPSMAAMLGYTPAEMLGKTPFDFLDETLQPQIRRQLAERSGGIVAGREFCYRHRNGSLVWTRVSSSPLRDERGETVGLLAMVTDTTAERKAQEALFESERRFRLLIEHSPDAIAVANGKAFIYANPRVCSLTGYSSEELAAGAFAPLLPPAEQALMLKRVGELLEGRPQAPVTYHLQRRDGTVADVETSSLRIAWEGAPAVVSFIRDVTERNQLEVRLRLADRLASVGTLAAGVAHEINNPLAYVHANLASAREILEAAAANPPEALSRLGEAAEALREAQEGAERVRVIVRELKIFSRSDDLHVGPVDVHKLLGASANMAWNEIRHRARLVKDYAQRLPPARGNEARLGQVFLNLLVNAAQALPEGSADRNEIRILTRAEGDRVVIEVRDTGAGIAPEHRPHLFDPFFTTKAVGSGTGLGLSICHNIVTSLGGELSVESELGKGSTFRVSLPAAAEQPAAAQLTASAEAPAAARRGRVLVVDDEPQIGSAIVRTLRRDHDVVVLTRARAALERLRGGEAFDVILCDVMMPEMSGLELHAELSLTDSRLAERIVFITGGAFSAQTQAVLDGMPNECISKPFDIGALRALVSERVAGRG
jgi:PAS domain S-box-containing protein